jgi:Tol biopolymer transport system component
MDIWVTKPDGGNRHALTDDFHEDKCPAAASDGSQTKYIVFISNRSGSDHVWRADADGKNPRELTLDDGQTYEKSPAVSKDGFVIGEIVDNTKGFWKRSLEGTQLEVIAPNLQAYLPAVSQDGKQIAYFFWPEPPRTKVSLGIMSFDGSNQRELTDLPPDLAAEVNLQWSQDGRAVRFVAIHDGVSNIWAKPIDGSKATPLTTFQDASRKLFGFAYSPDDKQLALTLGNATTEVVFFNLK